MLPHQAMILPTNHNLIARVGMPRHQTLPFDQYVTVGLETVSKMDILFQSSMLYSFQPHNLSQKKVSGETNKPVW